MDGEIIPFGKYKGQDIETVRPRDPQYLQWLMQQAWFAEKFQPIYQIVVNNFAPASEDTPAHNALQVRFLEAEYRSAFWAATGITIDWQSLCGRYWRNTAHLRKAPRPCVDRRNLHKRREWERQVARVVVDRHRENVRQIWATWRKARRPAEGLAQQIVGEPKFETECDVEFSVEACVGYSEDKHFRNLNAHHSHRLMIEIKPSIGDDYPAVLRQIKRQQAAAKTRYADDYRVTPHWFLLVDQFAAEAVTLDQVRAIFASDNIKVVLTAEVQMPPKEG